ncbi:hypothetical protein ABT56_19070 [Photobacterium aquae]|uniref:Uncharacterized protein n=2 Tax=Photobacterium aquae TaxID=1195763 RepID=A0A0J1GV82_9GAMM|nr:hypothetical protein ABT56_19070 [Photobacterium aquae]
MLGIDLSYELFIYRIGDDEFIDPIIKMALLEMGIDVYACKPIDEEIQRTINSKTEKRILRVNLKYPLKFSYKKEAVYNFLSASTVCEYQGYFYPSEDEYDY